MEYYPQWATRAVYTCLVAYQSTEECRRTVAAVVRLLRVETGIVSREEEPCVRMLVIKRTATFKPAVCVG